MAVAEVQAALARLSTDPAARALLLSDPAAFARAAGLSPEEMKGLMTTADSSLHVFALSLLHKRSHEAARSIPRTRAAIGEPFSAKFLKRMRPQRR